MIRRLTLVFTPQPEGGFTVTSPVLPEFVTEGDTLDETLANVHDAFAAIVELYRHERRPLAQVAGHFRRRARSIERRLTPPRLTPCPPRHIFLADMNGIAINLTTTTTTAGHAGR
jgi:antitoxin HicB